MWLKRLKQGVYFLWVYVLYLYYILLARGKEIVGYHVNNMLVILCANFFFAIVAYMKLMSINIRVLGSHVNNVKVILCEFCKFSLQLLHI